MPRTSLASIIQAMTFPDVYSSLVKPTAAEATGTRAAATVDHFIFATSVEECFNECSKSHEIPIPARKPVHLIRSAQALGTVFPGFPPMSSGAPLTLLAVSPRHCNHVRSSYRWPGRYSSVDAYFARATIFYLPIGGSSTLALMGGGGKLGRCCCMCMDACPEEHRMR